MSFWGPVETDIERALGIKGVLECYGCVLCQRTHFEGDELFDPHKGHQSKHGITQVRAEVAANARAEVNQEAK